MNPDYITLKNLSRAYREGDTVHPVLSEVDFTFARGEIAVLFGRSGSGKSTLLNLLSGIDLPDTGDILLDGTAINRMSEGERTRFRRRQVGFVFQFFNLIPTLTVLENLLLPLELNGQSGPAAIRTSRDLLERVGLEKRADSFPDRLSGGEQQRVAIARALVHDPAIILADEPTGNLDAQTGKEVINLLDQMVRQQKKTMIMATHSREVIGLADRILSLRQGKLSVRNREEFV